MARTPRMQRTAEAKSALKWRGFGITTRAIICKFFTAFCPPKVQDFHGGGKVGAKQFGSLPCDLAV